MSRPAEQSISLQSSTQKIGIFIAQEKRSCPSLTQWIGMDQISGTGDGATNCSIALEIVFCVPHNDLSSFSISRAVVESISGSFFRLSSPSPSQTRRRRRKRFPCRRPSATAEQKDLSQGERLSSKCNKLKF
jgi:hypothetical protein